MIGIFVAAPFVLLVVWIVLHVSLGYGPPRLPNAKHLSTKEQAIIAACADALFPADGPIPLSGTEAGLVAYMDAYLGRMAGPPRMLCRLLFLLLEHGPWIFGPQRVRFTKLSAEERIRSLDVMRASDVYFRRIAFLSIRTMLTMGYLANGDVARSMGMVHAATPYEQAYA